MAWKNQGGGPWGPGPKGPWGSGPQSSGPTPPDLEDLIRRGQDRMRTLIPGGGFNQGGPPGMDPMAAMFGGPAMLPGIGMMKYTFSISNSVTPSMPM